MRLDYCDYVDEIWNESENLPKVTEIFKTVSVLTNSNLTFRHVFIVAIPTLSTHFIVIFARYLISSTFHTFSNCNMIVILIMHIIIIVIDQLGMGKRKN